MKKTMKLDVLDKNGNAKKVSRVFNTETSEKIGERNISYFGDPCGYQENLYRTKNGIYFLHVIGGEESDVAKDKTVELTDKGYELICILTSKDAELWATNPEVVCILF